MLVQDGELRVRPTEAWNYAPGDILSTGQMVLRVDRGSGTVTIGKATWWRKARVWLRGELIDAWRWMRCTVADGWARIRRDDDAAA